jgi:hypothetical protein
MTQLIELQLPGGKSIFVEADTPATGGMREMSGGSVERITKKFDEIAETLGGVAQSLEQHLSGLDLGPKKVEVEIHAVVKGGGMLFFAQGSVEGGIKLKLTWDR